MTWFIFREIGDGILNVEENMAERGMMTLKTHLARFKI